MDRTEHRFSPSGRLPGGDFRVRRQSCQQDGAEQQRERAAPPGHVCASAHGGVSGAQSRFAGADCPAGQPCRPADCRAHCRAHCRMESVHVPPPFLAAVYALRRFFMRAGGLPCGGVPFASPGLNPGGTGYPCPGGEDHLKRRRRLRRIVPSPPVPPLLGCRHCLVFAANRKLLAWGARMAGTISAANGLMQGCRGRSPRRNKVKSSPFPTGEGGRGDRGQEIKLKAG